ncbi:hypothetical protein GQ457_15G004280 [Hibiscus cannabinus]
MKSSFEEQGTRLDHVEPLRDDLDYPYSAMTAIGVPMHWLEEGVSLTYFMQPIVLEDATGHGLYPTLF